MGNYIHDWGGHKSDFHNVTQYGSKMCHATVTGVTCSISYSAPGHARRSPSQLQIPSPILPLQKVTGQGLSPSECLCHWFRQDPPLPTCHEELDQGCQGNHGAPLPNLTW